jgi:hypothetical protein
MCILLGSFVGFDNGSNLGFLEDKKKKKTETTYFFDYNTVERVLLASSIVICLAGIMFETGRFVGRKDLYWQRDTITIVVLLTVVFSLVYYFVVFIAEVGAGGVFVLWLIKCFSEKKRIGNGIPGGGKGRPASITLDDGDMEMQMMVNPAMYTNGQASKEEKERRKAAEENLKNVVVANRQLQDQLKKSKQSNLAGKHGGRKGRGGNKEKKGFGQKKTSF